jgi:hypothetical protein
MKQMAEDNTGTENQGQGTENQGAGDEDRSTWTADQWKAEAEKWQHFSRKNESAAKANADAAKKLAQIEQDKLSEIEKAQQRAQAAEERANRLELDRLKDQVAKAKKLPAWAASRLQGSTKEELEADAEAVAKEMNLGTPAPDLRQGRQGPRIDAKDGKDAMNAFIFGNRR